MSISVPPFESSTQKHSLHIHTRSLSCHTLSAGHFGAVHKATLLPLSSEPLLQTVSVRVVGSHCPEREAVALLREACVMMQLCHRNVATVLGIVLSQCPVIFTQCLCCVHTRFMSLCMTCTHELVHIHQGLINGSCSLSTSYNP